jgi:hypothetical protein
MGEAIALDFELTPEDYAEFWSFHSQRSPFLRRSRRKSQFIVPAVWLGIAALGGISAGDSVWVALSILWIAGVPAYVRWCTRQGAKRIAEQGVGRGCIGPHRLVIDARGVMDSTPFFESRLFWTAIEEVVDAPRQVLLYTGAHAALIIPKRAFASELAVGGFVEGMNDLKEAATAPSHWMAGARETSA